MSFWTVVYFAKRGYPVGLSSFGFGNFMRCGSLKSEPTRRFLRSRLLRASEKCWASVLGRVRVEYLGPCPWPACGMNLLGQDVGMCLVNLQICEALSISVEAGGWVQFMVVRGKFENGYVRVRF